MKPVEKVQKELFIQYTADTKSSLLRLLPALFEMKGIRTAVLQVVFLRHIIVEFPRFRKTACGISLVVGKVRQFVDIFGRNLLALIFITIIV